jgi:glycosyltransferase involved in cell wall biosynthesis
VGVAGRIVGRRPPRRSSKPTGRPADFAVLRAFSALKRERRLSDLKLVKVGGPGGSEAPFRARTLALVRALGLDDDVVFTEHVPDEDLSAWYSGAACLA